MLPVPEELLESHPLSLLAVYYSPVGLLITKGFDVATEAGLPKREAADLAYSSLEVDDEEISFGFPNMLFFSSSFLPSSEDPVYSTTFFLAKVNAENMFSCLGFSCIT